MGARSRPRVLAGVDTGGTFTDFIVLDAQGLRVHKVLSTPEAPERAILQGLEDLGIAAEDLRLRHGSTVATNAVLEGKGARVVLLTQRGLGDLLTIGRQNRAALYDLSPRPETPPVPAEDCIETGGRLDARGREVEPLTEADIAEAVRAVTDRGPDAVAISLLFSYLDDRFERALAAAMPDSIFVSCSSAVLPEIGEYERGIATWLNGTVGPIMHRYLGRLGSRLPGARIAVMQSSGLTMSADQAADRAVELLLSGPAGGLSGALAMGRRSGIERMLTLDVGGTSSDVALLDGSIRLTRRGRVGRYPVAVPMVDLHTIGAGGGSLARVDDQGLLHVGPESAGASPGPACYGRGGTVPTLTDANLILGRIPPGVGLADTLEPDLAAARQAMSQVAEPLSLTVEEAAAGVVRVANEHMAGALRVISVARGHDPREFALCCFGGAGGLHACELAALLEMPRVLVPLHAGVLSALGMLVAPPGRERTRSRLEDLLAVDAQDLEAEFLGLSEPATDALLAEGIDEGALSVLRFVDLRYQGQSTALTVPWSGVEASAEAFHRLHRQRYGHDLDHPVELVNLRVRVTGLPPEVAFRGQQEPAPRSLPTGAVWRGQLEAGVRVEGPVAVLERTGTTWVAPGWVARLDQAGNLLLEPR